VAGREEATGGGGVGGGGDTIGGDRGRAVPDEGEATLSGGGCETACARRW